MFQEYSYISYLLLLATKGFMTLFCKAVSAFILEVISRHGDPAEIICAKEPFLMTQAGFLASSFPNSKIIHVVRDGRAVSHSLVSRNLEFPPFSSQDHSQNLKQWAKLSTGWVLRISISIDNFCEQIHLKIIN